jgi:hypothetical protein
MDGFWKVIHSLFCIANIMAGASLPWPLNPFQGELQIQK